jgi:hypothetical protein
MWRRSTLYIAGGSLIGGHVFGNEAGLVLIFAGLAAQFLATWRPFPLDTYLPAIERHPD